MYHTLIADLQMALKCADLGHLAAPWPVHQKWVAGLEEELFRQGDTEKQLEMPISPLMDRSKGGITKSQVTPATLLSPADCLVQVCITLSGSMELLTWEAYADSSLSKV